VEGDYLPDGLPSPLGMNAAGLLGTLGVEYARACSTGARAARIPHDARSRHSTV